MIDTGVEEKNRLRGGGRLTGNPCKDIESLDFIKV
tara:strand:+ start:1040 stop:1144 length:105 start_codon:yes stop_codon:yes gene_type:complete